MYQKNGSKGLKTLEDFKDDFVFEHKYTGKNLLIYTEEQKDIDLTDYLGYTLNVTDKSGCCLVPTTYVLGKSQEYADLISDDSSERAVYKE